MLYKTESFFRGLRKEIEKCHKNHIVIEIFRVFQTIAARKHPTRRPRHRLKGVMDNPESHPYKSPHGSINPRICLELPQIARLL